MTAGRALVPAPARKVAPGAHNSARVIGVIGKSGQGKGVYIKFDLIAGWRGPVLVWSPLEESDQYAKVVRGGVVTSMQALVAAVRAGHTRIVFEPGLNVPAKMAPGKWLKLQFALWCAIAYELRGWMIVVEELSDVTTASHAPAEWSKLSKQGRHRGITLVAAMQRPAQADKDFLGNCTEIRCYKVGAVADAKTMANVLFCTPAEILKMQKFHYRHLYMDTDTQVQGIAQIPGGAPPHRPHSVVENVKTPKKLALSKK